MKEKKCIMSLAVKKRVIFLALFILLSLLVSIFVYIGNRPDIAAFSQKEREAYSENMNGYRLSLVVHEEDHAVAVIQEVTVKNRSADTFPDLVMRTFANAFWQEETSPAASDELYDSVYGTSFSKGGLTFSGVWWQDKIVPCEFTDRAQTVMHIETGNILPGEEGVLRLHYVIHLPKCDYRFGITKSSWQMGNAFPVLSVWEKGAWREDSYYPVGDPFVSESAVWKVKAQLPENWTIGASCDMKKTGKNLWQGEILCARDMGMVLYPKMQPVSKDLGSVKVTVFADGKEEKNKAVSLSQDILEIYSRLYGKYPYDTLTVCQVEFPFGGMEYPACVFIGKDAFSNKGDALEQVLAHEIAHQWFYALAGSDQVMNPWQDESLCQWAVLSYVGEKYGKDSQNILAYDYLDAPMEEKVLSDVTPASPIHYFPDLNTYSSVVYGRGAAFLRAVDLFTHGQTNDFLKSYCTLHPFGLYTREDFENHLYAFTGEDLSPLVTDYLDTLMQ